MSQNAVPEVTIASLMERLSVTAFDRDKAYANVKELEGQIDMDEPGSTPPLGFFVGLVTGAVGTGVLFVGFDAARSLFEWAF